MSIFRALNLNLVILTVETCFCVLLSSQKAEKNHLNF